MCYVLWNVERIKDSDYNIDPEARPGQMDDFLRAKLEKEGLYLIYTKYTLFICMIFLLACLLLFFVILFIVLYFQ